jgi:YVTN family beta-propeller protein
VRRREVAVAVVLAALAIAGCEGSTDSKHPARKPASSSHATSDSGGRPARAVHDVYAADRAGLLSAAVRHDPARVYVPNSQSNTVDVIDQRTYKVVDHFATGGLPQHVTPSWDLKRLWVDNDVGNTLTPINPRSGKHGKPIPVEDPYNLYFTVDGRYAIVVAERLQKLDFRDAKTMKLRRTVRTPCRGVDHMDFTASGRYALVSCEFSGQMLKLDVARRRIAKTISLRAG